MLQMLRKRLHKDEEGFTLIELMVVVLIIAILLAIAIPTFLGARTRAQHRSTQSNLRNALTAEKTLYTDNQAYVDGASAPLQAAEPTLKFDAPGTAPAAGTNEVEVFASAGFLCMAATSADGNTYWIGDNSSGTFYSKTGQANFTAPTTDATCASQTWTVAGGGWASSPTGIF